MKIHKLAGKTVKVKLLTKPFENLKDGADFTVEDWADNVFGQSWGMMQGNPTALIYAIRSTFGGMTDILSVVYGKVNGLAYLVHDSELIFPDCLKLKPKRKR